MKDRTSVLNLHSLPVKGGYSGARWGARLRASGCHLALSSAVAILVLACVYLGWYRDPLDSISGVGEILLLLLAVDVTLGPLMTFVVFDRRKKNLSLDLACIGVMQLAALLYGMHAIEAGRPHYIVFVKDRFEVVSTADLQPEDRAAANGNPAAQVDWFGPRIVSATMPSSAKEREQMLFESLSGGRDLQHFPERYRSYESQAELAAEKAKPLEELRVLNPESLRELDAAVARIGLPESRLRFLPIKGPAGDATMLVEASTGVIQGMVNLRPWR